MLIRSQDGMKIVNMNNIDTLSIWHSDCTDDGWEICSYNGDYNSSTLLGEFKDIGNAMKVLDAIVKHYKSYEYSMYIGNDDSVFTSPVYEIPAEDKIS